MPVMNVFDPTLITVAMDHLNRGRNIIAPSDTVYGVLANIHDEQSVAGIYRVKQRRSDNPVGIFTTKEDIGRYAHLSNGTEQTLMTLFPSPVGVILKKRSGIPDYLTSGRDTVMIMCHEHRFLNDLYRAMGAPIGASSVNISGEQPATTHEETRKFEDKVALLVDGGITRHRLNGTILDLTEKPRLMRQGAYPVEALLPLFPGLEVVNTIR
jgi:L-threonylcarbamoyladenylate synthase